MPRTGEQIHCDDASEVALWCAALGVSEAELLAAVSAVGHGSARVVMHLLESGAIKGHTLADALANLRAEESPG